MSDREPERNEDGDDDENRTSSLTRVQTLSNQQFNVVRRVYRQDSLNIEAEYHTPQLTFARQIKRIIRKCGFGECLRNSVPIIHWLPKYDINENLMGDFIAGTTTAIVNVPHSLAYSLLAYCIPSMGLFMAFFPIFIYVIFGNSPHVCLGAFAAAMVMAGKVVLDHATVPGESVGPYTPEEVICALSFTVGLILLVMWCLRLGAMSSLLSEPLISGLITGAAFQVVASQLKDLFGIRLHKLPANFKIIYNIIEICKHLTETNWATFTLSFISCFFLAVSNEHIKPWLSKRCRVPMQAELIIIVVATQTSRYVDFETNYDVEIVGEIPTGLPWPSLPPFELVGDLFLDAVSLTMVTYTITMSVGLIFAAKHKYEIDANQELLAMGASNIFGCFFVCGPVCASMSRSFLQHAAGCKTLMTSLISAMLMLLVLLWIGPFFETLPRGVLASIIVVTLKRHLMHVCDFLKFWKLSKLDATVWIVTFFVCVLVNLQIGVVAGLVSNVATLFFRTQTPYSCILGRVLDTNLYLDVKRYRAARELPGIKIFHYCGSLNFASKNMFRNKLFRKTGYLSHVNPKHSVENNLTHAKSYIWNRSFSQLIRCIIVDATALSYVDAPGIKILIEMHQAFKSSGITMLLSGPSGPILEMIDRFNSFQKDRLELQTFPTIHDAVTYYKLLQKNKLESSLSLSDTS